MKRLLIGAAVGALLLPASAAFAQDADHDHACIDETCSIVSLFSGEETAAGWQGTQAPRYGTWGFDMAGRDTAVKPGDDFFQFANGKALEKLVIPSDRTSYGSFALLRELSDNRMKELVTGPGRAPRSGPRFGRGQDRRRLSLLQRRGAYRAAGRSAAATLSGRDPRRRQP